MEVFPSVEDLRNWADHLEEVQERLAPYFERAEPRQRAMAYIPTTCAMSSPKSSCLFSGVLVSSLEMGRRSARREREG